MLPRMQYFRRPKITDHQSFALDQHVLRLQIAMANTNRVHVIQSSEHLIHEYFGIESANRVHSHQLEIVELVCLHCNVKILVFPLFCGKGA